MNEKKSKNLRKLLRVQGVAISSEPYQRLGNGQIISSIGRLVYQRAKNK